MPAFVKLADPASYVACDWDLTEDADGRGHWVPFFKRHLDTILKLGVECDDARGIAGAAARAGQSRKVVYERFDASMADPKKYGVVTILTLDDWRDNTLREFGFVDPFYDLKERENEKMLPIVPKVCRQLDELSGDEQARAAVENIFAGNIFDMGAEATAKAFLSSSPDFFEIRAQLKPRPWRIDDYDALLAKLTRQTHRKLVFFIDNAGSDFLLGALPFMRWMARRGARVVLAANERPTLNDMTIHDVRRWWPRVVAVEPSIGGLPIELVSTGTGEPLIDLAEVSAELNDACHDADLVVLEGMGRGVESNLDARFSCDALNIAMVKDVAVARRVRGELYDLVCRFR
jgi:damage-control phosphatase, subfamily II, stand-alone protein